MRSPRFRSFRLGRLVAVPVATLTLIACVGTTTGQGGAADGGSDSTTATVAECCQPSPQPNCGPMVYGGWMTPGTTCAGAYDGMPVSTDPGWKLEEDNHGCPRWTNPNDYFNGGKQNPATKYCGGVFSIDASVDSPTVDSDGSAADATPD